MDFGGLKIILCFCVCFVEISLISQMYFLAQTYFPFVQNPPIVKSPRRGHSGNLGDELELIRLLINGKRNAYFQSLNIIKIIPFKRDLLRGGIGFYL